MCILLDLEVTTYIQSNVEVSDVVSANVINIKCQNVDEAKFSTCT